DRGPPHVLRGDDARRCRAHRADALGRVGAAPEVGVIVGEVDAELNRDGDHKCPDARPRPRATVMNRDGCADEHGRHGCRERRRPHRRPPHAGGRQRSDGHGGHLRALRKLGEVRLALLHVRVAPFLRLFAQVVEKRRVAGELLDPGQPVVRGVEAGLQQAQRERAQLEHAPAPPDGLLLELVERHDLVDEAHLQRLLRVVLLAEEPDLARLLLADAAREQAGAVPAVEAADARPGLAEARVVGRDRQVADDVQHVAAADRVARDHGDDGLRQAPDLDLEVQHVQAADALGVDVAVVAADPLVAAGAEGLRPGARQDHDADGGIVARRLEGADHLEDGRRAERVADLGPVDRDPGDAVPGVVEDVLVLARLLPPLNFQVVTPRAVTSTFCHRRRSLPLAGMSADPLAARARSSPKGLALIDRGDPPTPLTWAQLDAMAALWAHRLTAAGIVRGDRVAVADPAGARFAALLHACIRIGAVIVPLPSRGRDNELARLIAQARPRAVIRHGEVELHEAGMRAEGDLCLLFTSGTMGAPKPVRLTLANHRASARGLLESIGRRRDDTWLLMLSPHHVGGFAIYMRSVLHGQAVVSLPAFDAAAAIAALEDERPSLVSAVPSMITRLLDAGGERALSRPRAILVGGAPATSDQVREWVRVGLNVCPTYGMTETCSQVATVPPGRALELLGTAGFVHGQASVTIDDGVIGVSGPVVSPSF